MRLQRPRPGVCDRRPGNCKTLSSCRGRDLQRLLWKVRAKVYSAKHCKFDRPRSIPLVVVDTITAGHYFGDIWPAFWREVG